MGLMNDLFGSPRRKKKSRRKSTWIADGTHHTKAAAMKRARALRKSGHRTRVGKMPNGSYYVFKR